MDSCIGAFSGWPRVVLGDAIAGGRAVGLRLLLFMSLVDDDVAGIPTDVDDVA